MNMECDVAPTPGAVARLTGRLAFDRREQLPNLLLGLAKEVIDGLGDLVFEHALRMGHRVVDQGS